MGSRQDKDRLYEQFARITKAMGSPRRVELLDLLCQGERTVEGLARETGLSVANVSQHLQQLKASRLVASRRDDRYVHYRLADPEVGLFLRGLQTLARQQLAEADLAVRAYFGDAAGMTPVDRAELLRRTEAGEVVLLDVRPVEEYRAGHLPEAVSVPAETLPEIIGLLPRDKTIVAYCRGPYCVFAAEAVAILRREGFHAFHLADGVLEWRTAGLPVEIGMPTGV